MASTSGVKFLSGPPELGHTVSGELVGADSPRSDDSGDEVAFFSPGMTAEERAQKLREGILTKDQTLVGR